MAPVAPLVVVVFQEVTVCVFRISELIERETGEYQKADPDPFDDRHPGELRLSVQKQHGARTTPV